MTLNDEQRRSWLEIVEEERGREARERRKRDICLPAPSGGFFWTLKGTKSLCLSPAPTMVSEADLHQDVQAIMRREAQSHRLNVGKMAVKLQIYRIFLRIPSPGYFQLTWVYSPFCSEGLVALLPINVAANDYLHQQNRPFNSIQLSFIWRAFHNRHKAALRECGPDQ